MITAAIELRAALARRRVFALNLAVPLLLVLPIAFSGAPPHHAAAVYTVLFTLFGTFGSAIPLVRDAETGLFRRVALTGYPPRRLLVERILAHAALDLLQLVPALAVLLLADGRARHAAVIAIVMAGTLVCANALGIWIAALARSIAEAALFAAVTALLALHGAGVFRTPAADSLAADIERWIPFRLLHETLLGAIGGHGPTPASGTDIADAGTTFAVGALQAGGALLAAAAFIAVTVATAPRIATSLHRIGTTDP